jgi:hypothetical protein
VETKILCTQPLHKLTRCNCWPEVSSLPVAELPIKRDEYVYARENVSMLNRSGKALLFDVDGTLTDTDGLHVQAFNQIFGPRTKVQAWKNYFSPPRLSVIASRAQ